MAKSLKTCYGRIKKHPDNPRRISDSAFTKLCDSICRDLDFMCVNKIKIDENNIILGGNQRYSALVTMYENAIRPNTENEKQEAWADELAEGKLPDDFIVRVSTKENPWSEEKKRRFVLIDNSPEGMSGEFDYDIMQESFGLDILNDSGVDFSRLDQGTMDDFGKSETEKIEEGPMGEEQLALNKKFKDARELFRKNAHDIEEGSHYVVCVFQSNAQKAEVIKALKEKFGIDSFIDIFVNGIDVCEHLGIELKRELLKEQNELSPINRLKKLTMHPEVDEGEADESEADDDSKEADEE